MTLIAGLKAAEFVDGGQCQINPSGGPSNPLPSPSFPLPSLPLPAISLPSALPFPSLLLEVGPFKYS